MNLKRFNIRKKHIICISIILVFCALLFSNKDIIYNLGNVEESNALATSYDSVTEFSEARWTEIQNEIFGEGVASSVSDFTLRSKDVVDGNPYFNWTDTSNLGITAWRGGTTKSDGTAITDEDFYVDGAIPTETYNYSTEVDGGGTSSRTVTYQVYNVDTAEKLVYILSNKGTDTTTDIKVNITQDIDMGGKTNKLLSRYVVNKGTRIFYIEGNNHTIYNLNTTRGLINEIWSGFIAKNLNFKSVRMITSDTITSIARQSNAGIFGGVYTKTKGFYLYNINVDEVFEQSTSGGSAVLMGCIYASNAYIEKCSVSNAYVRGNGGHVGAIMAISCSGVDSPVKYNATIPDTPEATFGNAGTTYGADDPVYPIIVEDSYAIDSEIHSTSGHSGGFIACDGGGIIVRNCFTNNSMYGEKQTGGFIGCQISVKVSEERKSAGNMLDDTGESTCISAYFENCYSSGVVEGKSEIGGFVGTDAQQNRGETGGATIYKNCYSTCMVGMDYSGTYVGGFVGIANNLTPNVTVDGYGTFTGSLYLNCYAAGEVGNVGTDTDIDTASSKLIGGFMGGYNSNTASISNIYNCYYDKQTTAMREVAVGQEGNDGTCQLKGVTGVYTQESEIKGVQGLTNIDMQDGSAWIYKDGYYPQLRVFADNAESYFTNYNLVESYSTASAATVFLNHWDSIMDEEGVIADDADATTIYDTIRDITSSFEFTSNANSSSAGYDITWSVDSDTNSTKGYVEELNITQEDGTVKAVSVLSIQNPVKNASSGASFGLDSSDIYKCYDFAPGKSWVKVTAENTLGENAVGTRKLRLIPKAYLDAGEYAEITLVTDNDGNVTQNKIQVGDEDVDDTSYLHAEDTMYVITDDDKLADNKVVYPGQVVSQDEDETNLFALWDRYPSDLNSSSVTTDDFDDMYLQALIGDSEDTGLTKVEVYSLGITYKTVETDNGTATVPVIDYDTESRITGNALEDTKWRGEELFDSSDTGWYELKYYWRLNDGRYLTDSKIVIIKGNELSATLYNNIIKGETDYENEDLDITPDIKQDTTSLSDLVIDSDRTAEDSRGVETTISDNGTVTKTIKIKEFVDDELVAGWKNDDGYQLIELKVEVSRDGAAWVTLPIDIENSTEVEYSYANQTWQVKQYTDTKQYYIDTVGDSTLTTLKASLVQDASVDNDYIKFVFVDDDTQTSDLVTNSNIRITATFAPVKEITVTKEWVDDGNLSSLRPTSIILKVVGSDEEEYTSTVTGSTEDNTDWNATFTVPMYDTDENEITYTIGEEVDTDIYEATIDEDNLKITNTIIKYDVTTSVDGVGGTISGQNDEVYEEVVKNNSNTKDIVITPDEGYEIESIKINGVEQPLPDYDDRDEAYTLPVITNITEDKVVVVTFRENVIDLTVTKVWEDNSNENTKRPSSIKLQVLNGDTVVDEQTVATLENNTQSYTFEDLPKYDSNGNVITYTVDEDEVNTDDLYFYTKAIDTTTNTITNTFTVPDEKISLTATKVWDDNSNANGKRPTSIKIRVKNGDSIVDENEISGTGNTWEYTFENLPKYDSKGDIIVYTVDETEVNTDDLKFYTSTVDNTTNTITNKFTVPSDTIEITAQKEWLNEPNTSRRPESVILVIKNAGVEVQRVEVSENTDWKATFTNLPKYNSKGNEITYTIDEEEKTTGDLKFYTKTIDNNTYTVTNTFEVPDDRISVTATKVWDDNSNVANKRPKSITIELYANGVKTRDQYITVSGDTQTYEFTDLPKYDSDGEDIVYTVGEVETNTDDLKFYTSTVDNTTYTITNTFTVPSDTTTITVTKVWDDNSNEKNKRPSSIVINLYANGVYSTSYTITDTTGDKQTYTFENLPKYDSLGNVITYTVDEAEASTDGLKFYTKTIDNVTNTITNTFTVPSDTVDVTATKVWDDTSNVAIKRPTYINIKLYANEVEYKTQQITTTEDTQSYTFENLPKYDSDGNVITYTIGESEVNTDDLKFYTSTIDTTTNTITNTFTVPSDTVSVPVTKVWDDNSDENEKRPDSLKLVVKKSGVEVASYTIEDTSSDSQSYTFTGLPKYNELGNEINYTVDEEAVNDGDLEFYTKKVTGTTITNTFTVPEDKVTLTASKTWNDNDDEAEKRPDSVIIVVLSGETQIQEQTLNDANNWQCSFTDLPKYDSSGNEISYTLAEKESALGDLYFYETEVDNNNIKLKNTFRVPDDKVEMAVTKVWDDNSNAAGKRPSSINIDLYANGVKTDTHTITDTTTEDSQTYTFTDLPKYDSLGNVITYTVDESEVTTGDLYFYNGAVSGGTITNTFTVPNEKTSLTVTKVWSDGSNAAGKRPSSIVVNLYADGTYLKNQVISDTTTGDSQTYTFEDLPKYDSNGDVITYTVNEAEVNTDDLKFYSKVVDDTTNTITNTFEVPDDTVDYTVTKNWVDESNNYLKRPSSLEIKLYADGEYLKSYKIEDTSEDSQTYTFTDLPKYDENGKEIDYTVGEAEVNTDDLKFYSKNVSGNTITNTFRVPDDKVSYTVTKTWDDDSDSAEKRPDSIEIDLYSNGTYKDSYIITDTTANTQSYTFENLPKYDSSGVEIKYTVKEKETAVGDLKFYESTIEENSITNTFTVPDEKVNVTATKIWNDNSDEAEKRPDSIEIKLYADEEYLKSYTIEDTSEDTQTYTFENLPKYDSKGNVISYTIDEAEVNEGDLYFYKKSKSGTTITNTFTVPSDTVDITATKKWVDSSTLRRPETLNIVLKSNGVELKTQKITIDSNETQTYTFTGLPKYDSLGNEITYTVDESEVNEGDLYFYTKTGIDDTTNTITNTFELPDDTISIKATKVWDDNSNKARKRPSSVVLQVKNGDTVVQYKTVTSVMNWEYEFTDLPKYDAIGNEIEYTVDEIEASTDDLKFYTKTVDNDNYIITNTFSVPDEETSLTVTKVWSDDSDIAEKRPSSILIEVKNGTTVAKTQEITGTEDEWSYTIEGLSKYDENGDVIRYTIDEKATNTGELAAYSKKTSAYTITNTVKTYNITTSVDGVGGTISGEDEDPYETVYYSNDSTKEIKVTPDYGYKISSITVNGTAIEFTPEEDKTYTLSLFTDVTEDKEVVATFEKMDAVVEVKHVTEDGTDLVDPETKTGKVGDEYSTEAKEFDNYILKEIPENYTGVMTEDKITVTYVYTLVKGSITVTKTSKSDDTKLIEGATYRLEKVDDDTFTPIEETTDETGVIKYTDLLVGKYTITEIQAPEGYELAKNSIEVEITKNDSDLSITATDTLKLVMPETGGINYTVLMVIIGAVIMTGVIVINKKA